MRTPRVAAALAAVLALTACTTAHGGTRRAFAGSHPLAGQPSTPASAGATATGALPGAAPTGVPPRVITHGSRSGRQVALTFDADMTDTMLGNLAAGRVHSYANTAVLDILERDRVPATFFLTAQWTQAYPDITRRLAADPRFELANHSYRHDAFTPHCYHLGQVPPERMTDDVARAFTVISAYGGRQTRYFRFPGGCYDDAALRALAPLGLTVIQWDVVSGDPFVTSAAPVVQAVLSRVGPGSIVVMHITEANAEYTDEALPTILDGLRSRGLTPVTLSELLGTP